MGKMHQEGVTLIELLVALSVIAIIIAVGVPALRNFFTLNQMSAAVNDVVSSIHLARSEAVKRELPTRVCPSENWDADIPTCTGLGDMADGWIVVVDPNGIPVVVQKHEPLPDSVQLSHDFIDVMDFSSRGVPSNGNGVDEFNLLLCDDRGDVDTGGGVAAGRWINVRGTGRPRIYEEQADVQAWLGGC